LGLVSLLQFFMALCQSFIGAGLQAGLVRRSAGSSSPNEKAAIISTVLRLLLSIGLPLAGIFFITSDSIANLLLHSIEYSPQIKLYSVSFIFGLLTYPVLASAMVAKDFHATARINISNALLAPILFLTLCPLLGIAGGLYAVAFAPAAGCAVAWLVARNRPWWPAQPWAAGFDGDHARAVASLWPQAAINSLAMTMVPLLVRDQVQAESGLAAVGFLQGVLRLSDAYLSIITNVMIVYYLPRYASLKSSRELVLELRNSILLFVPAAAIIGGILYFFRDPIISIVFTPAFKPMRDLFVWQIAGNTLRIAGWLLVYVLQAKAPPWLLAAFELTIGLILWQLSRLMISVNGVIGATQAYALTYSIYVVLTLTGVTWIMVRMRRREQALDHEITKPN
jgi:PST family polysaccharide transporter